MEEYELVAELVGSIVWPAFGLVVFLFLRKPAGELIQELLPYIQSVKVKDVESGLNRDIAEAESKSTGIGEGEEERLLDQEMVRRIDISPRSAILESWLAVERELVETALAGGNQRRSPSAWAECRHTTRDGRAWDYLCGNCSDGP